MSGVVSCEVTAVQTVGNVFLLLVHLPPALTRLADEP